MGIRAKEIGSFFDINPLDLKVISETKRFELFGSNEYLSTCRSAIDVVLKNGCYKNKVALLPGFTCHAVVEPFIKNGFQVVPYAISTKLEIDIDALKKAIIKFQPSVVLVHDYFGFDSNSKLRESGLLIQLMNEGLVIINDQTQSMFSSYNTLPATYYLGSIRKWMGIPDGAFLKGMGIGYIESDKLLEESKVKAMVYKHAFLFNDVGTKEEVLAHYKESENILDSRGQCFSISDTSKKLICTYDLTNMKRRRRANAQTLLKELTKSKNISCPFKSVQSKEVPFFVPILVKNGRSRFQTYLAKNNVFATVIWGSPNEFKDKIDSETKCVYDEILCIPCDQRYIREDMEYICRLIKNYSWKE